MPYSPSEKTRPIAVEGAPPPSWWDQLVESVQRFVETVPGGWLTVGGLGLAGVLGVVGVAAYQEQQKLQWWMALK